MVAKAPVALSNHYQTLSDKKTWAVKKFANQESRGQEEAIIRETKNTATELVYLHVAPLANTLGKPPSQLSLSYHRPNMFIPH